MASLGSAQQPKQPQRRVRWWLTSVGVVTVILLWARLGLQELLILDFDELDHLGGFL